jgi:hypothetical protein
VACPDPLIRSFQVACCSPLSRSATGTFVLSVTRGNVPANDLQKSFFWAGHAHAGVLVILGLLALTSVQVNHVRAPYPAITLGNLGRGGPDAHRVLRVGDRQQPDPAKPRDRRAVGVRRRPDYWVDRGGAGTGPHRFWILNDTQSTNSPQGAPSTTPNRSAPAPTSLGRDLTSAACSDGKRGDGAAIAPHGKWSLKATVLGWYPGHARHRRRSQQHRGPRYFTAKPPAAARPEAREKGRVGPRPPTRGQPKLPRLLVPLRVLARPEDCREGSSLDWPGTTPRSRCRSSRRRSRRRGGCGGAPESSSNR